MSAPPQNYPYIRAWGKKLGSFDYYIRAQIERARETNAPDDALYERYDAQGRTGEWACLSDLAPDHPFRNEVQSSNDEREDR